jgi:hypothetical protein
MLHTEKRVDFTLLTAAYVEWSGVEWSEEEEDNG